MQIFLTILVLLVMLGILVSSHELGHLFFAKCFNVYCFEYSIGFGPKLFSKKPKNAETTFSIRAFPLGGYVSMFGEEGELPDGLVVPASRSLEAAKPWKKALIQVAGVEVNLFLAIFFTFIYAVCFPSYYTAAAFDTGLVDESSQTVYGYSFWGDGSIGGSAFDKNTNRLYSPYQLSSGSFVVDDAALIGGETYVAVFTPSSVNETALLSGLSFYSPLSSYYPSALREEMGLSNFPDTNKSVYHLSAENVSLELHLTILDVASYSTIRPEASAFQSRNVKTLTTTSAKNGDAYSWNDANPMKIATYQFYPSFGERMANGARDFAYFFQMIGLGFKAIFSLDFSQVGSIVAFGSVINTASASVGWGRTFFFFGGYLSLNLAIFNLLPFPGLDGWSLLVTVIEAIRKKKVSEKVKNIVSLVGLGLLFLFAILITVKDIGTLIGG